MPALARGHGRPQIGTMEKVAALWRGDLALGDAFWNWAVVGGLIVNVLTSILLLVLVTLDHVVLALVVGKGLSLPYNLLAVVGVWRAAATYRGPPYRADLARGTVVAMMVVLSVI